MTATGWQGALEHIHITPAKSQPMQALDSANLVVGKGIEGDRYFLETGTYSGIPGEDRQITLIEAEMLERVAQDCGEAIDVNDHRRNLTVSGVPLQHLVGLRFMVGNVVLEGVRINQPCKYLNLMLKRDVYMPLWNRSGLNCKIVAGGKIHVGDILHAID
ncbi:MOSC domain-containing protein [Roseovarius sp. 2305UL8-3]|uniref:MOSC domain-containing protein n=1 Tax=Roseovarius conchicola TaxID=3121636 RepID=UPI00352708C7